MGLLSAAASAPITKCSSFLPSPVALSVRLPLPYFNPREGALPSRMLKEKAGSGRSKGQQLVREVFTRRGFVFVGALLV